MRFTSRQQDGDQAPFSICECVYLRVTPAARAANSLFLLSLFAGRRAVSFDMRGVDHLRVRRATVVGQLPEQVFPDAAPRPTREAIVDRRMRTIGFGNRTSDSRSSAHGRCR